MFAPVREGKKKMHNKPKRDAASVNALPATRMNRRTFLTGVALGTGVGVISRFPRDVSARRAAAAFCAIPPVLTAQDLTFLGYYDIQTNSENTTYSQGLTHRYVNGDLRFLNLQLGGVLHEVSLAGRNYGDIITTTTNRWDLSSYAILRDFNGFWWEASQSRLWLTGTVDYTNTVFPVQIRHLTLNDNGTVSVQGPVGLSGINSKRVYGGMQAVPTWFQSQYGVGPYVVGWGGYTSLVGQGGGASIGPTMYAIPDPSSYANGSEIPTGQFKTVMDCAGAGSQDWYPAGHPTSADRGVRVTMPINYFDGGDPRQNPSTPPTGPPVAGAQWLSPAPDGLGRWVWGDSYYNTGCWIDGPNKRGFLLIASLGGGKCFYESSNLVFDKRQFEVHIYDPVQLGEAIQGVRAPWNVKPASLAELTLNGLGNFALEGNTPAGNPAGATYDPTTRRLYVIGFGANTYYSRLYVYAVNA
jgi:hypothetical protein